MKLQDKKLCIIGGGNLGISLAKGIAEKQIIPKSNITVTRRKAEYLSGLQTEGFNISNDNAGSIDSADFIIIAVQPKQLHKVVEEIGHVIHKKQMIISTLAGTSITMIKTLFSNDIKVLRAMPNTASAVGESITCLSGGPEDDESLSVAEELFRSIGDTLIIEENLMKAATVLGASGIAFFMRYLRAATQGGIQMGFHPEDAQRIAVQTAKGAAMLIQTHHTHPELEIDKVTTPQGCTIEGLNEMEHQGFSSALIKGLMTSFQRLDNIRG